MKIVFNSTGKPTLYSKLTFEQWKFFRNLFGKIFWEIFVKLKEGVVLLFKDVASKFRRMSRLIWRIKLWKIHSLQSQPLNGASEDIIKNMMMNWFYIVSNCDKEVVKDHNSGKGSWDLYKFLHKLFKLLSRNFFIKNQPGAVKF